MNNRVKEWQGFSEKVLNHIENYTIKQYGDLPDDQAVQWNAEDCIKQIQKYCNRHGKNRRTGQDSLDMLKIAHYAAIALNKIEDLKYEDWISNV